MIDKYTKSYLGNFFQENVKKAKESGSIINQVYT